MQKHQKGTLTSAVECATPLVIDIAIKRMIQNVGTKEKGATAYIYSFMFYDVSAIKSVQESCKSRSRLERGGYMAVVGSY